MATLTFDFEELPLIVSGGFEAGLVNGSAEVGYQADGEFFIKAIWLDGFRKRANGCGFTQNAVTVEQGSWLYNAIHEQLENGTFKGHVTDAVAAELSEISPRPFPSEHSTLNRAQQSAA